MRSAAGQATRTSAPRQSRLTRAAILAITFLLPALTLTACAAPTHYAGIYLRPGAANAEVQALAQQARGGSKEAQLELGIRYEEGTGVPLDVKRARKLYRLAAATTGGTIYVYVPATRKGETGFMTPVNIGSRAEGLTEAKERLVSSDRSHHSVSKLLAISLQFYDPKTRGVRFHPDKDLLAVFEGISPKLLLQFCNANSLKDAKKQKVVEALCAVPNMEALATYIAYETRFHGCILEVGVDAYSSGEDYDAVTSCILSRVYDNPTTELDDLSRRLVWRVFAASTTFSSCALDIKNGVKINNCLVPAGTAGWYVGLSDAISDRNVLSSIFANVDRHRADLGFRETPSGFPLKWFNNQCRSRRPWALPNPIGRSELILCELFKYDRVTVTRLR